MVDAPTKRDCLEDEARRQIDKLLLSLQEDGALNSQFKSVMSLEDDNSPNFGHEVVELFLSNTATNLAKVRGHLRTPTDANYAEVARLLILMKGSNATFGAAALAEQCAAFDAAVAAEDWQACVGVLAQQEDSLEFLRNKLVTFLELDRKRKEAAAAATGSWQERIPVTTTPGTSSMG